MNSSIRSELRMWGGKEQLLGLLREALGKAVPGLLEAVDKEFEGEDGAGEVVVGRVGAGPPQSSGSPFSTMDTEQIKQIAAATTIDATAVDHVAWLLPSAVPKLRSAIFHKVRRVRNRRGLMNIAMDEAFRMVRSNPTSQFLEFGVFKGVDLEFLSKALSKRADASGLTPPPTFHGFDSFTGLPSEWNSYDPGHFDCTGETPSRLRGNQHVVLHKGWFEDTIGGFITEHGGDSPVAFIHADADLYSSTKCFLSRLCAAQKIVVGTVIVFDEYWNYEGWEEGEALAFDEISAEFNLQSKALAYHAPPDDSIAVDNKSAANQYGYKSVAFLITHAKY
ncbi:hypothetical protein TrLO_g1819 [Triparma laevis f. longispina]|uniref:Uncharacterized protein n=1 Tax=Triparma laevis f. longispina TaxID=1714387 RepID=A0A9W7ADT5_9STRA|nr:hypothetical protein TrLO_g1819 [Triparma laevis f. longispina]